MTTPEYERVAQVSRYVMTTPKYEGVDRVSRYVMTTPKYERVPHVSKHVMKTPKYGMVTWTSKYVLVTTVYERVARESRLTITNTKVWEGLSDIWYHWAPFQYPIRIIVRSREVWNPRDGSLNYRTVVLPMCLSNFSDRTILNTNLAVSRLHEILR